MKHLRVKLVVGPGSTFLSILGAVGIENKRKEMACYSSWEKRGGLGKGSAGEGSAAGKSSSLQLDVGNAGREEGEGFKSLC